MLLLKQTSLFSDLEEKSLDKIVSTLKITGDVTPYSLVKKGLNQYTSKGDLILDPCCGIGTTGIAALELNRKPLLSDINSVSIRTAKSLFMPFDYKRIKSVWKELSQRKVIPTDVEEDNWKKFVDTELPPFETFHRIRKKNIDMVREIFHPKDLDIIKDIYIKIFRVEDLPVREILEVIFYSVLTEVSQVKISRNRNSFYLPKRTRRREPMKVFNRTLEVFLDYKRIIREEVTKDLSWTPKVRQASIYNLDYVDDGSIDYVVIHLPGLRGYREGEMSYLSELLADDYTNLDDEIIIKLDYQGRHRLTKDLKKILQEMDRILKEDGHLNLIFTGHHVLLSLIVRLAQNQGWKIKKEGIEMALSYHHDYSYISLTLQKKKQSTVLGALNKMKIDTLYDIEEAIIRKIDGYLDNKKIATLEEIQNYLLKNHLHECLIEKPLINLLEENYIYSGKFWIRPTYDQEEELLRKREGVLEDSFEEFVCEMSYNYLQIEKKALTYRDLMDKFRNIKSRSVFHTPYYRLLMEQCERREIELKKLIEELFEKRKKKQFDQLEDILRRILKKDPVFTELERGQLVGVEDWSADIIFKIYMGLYEKAKGAKDNKKRRLYGDKVLHLLDDITYLSERKKEKIEKYIKRSEE